MVRLWPTRAEDTSWWATRPGRRTEWMRTPPGPSPPRAPATTRSVGRGRAEGAAPGVRAGSRHPLGGAHRGARRGVELAVVVQLDDLGAVRTGRGQLGEAHHQHRADGEVGGHDDGVGAPTPAKRRASSARSASVNPVVPTTAWTPARRTRPGGPGRLDPVKSTDHLGPGRSQRRRSRRRPEVHPPRRSCPERLPGRCRPHRGRRPRPARGRSASSDGPAHLTGPSARRHPPPPPAARGHPTGRPALRVPRAVVAGRGVAPTAHQPHDQPITTSATSPSSDGGDPAVEAAAGR